jgi:uncharacterized repeat protein (TIGR02543 family)
VTYDSQYGMLPVPQRENYEFDGWHYNDDVVVSSTTVKIANDHTLTAYWK